MNVSFDFDGTLHRDGTPLWPAMALLRWHHESNHRVMIVTTRTERHEHRAWWSLYQPQRAVVAEFLARHRVPVHGVVFTEHQPKAASLAKHGIALHYDNDPNEVSLATAYGVRVILLRGVMLNALR